jgi:trimeric autotransporter adhesin
MNRIICAFAFAPCLAGSSVFGQGCNPAVAPTPGLSVFDNWVLSLHVHDDGSGSAGGWFNSAGTVQSPRIARWNGTEWSPVGTGPNPPIGGGVGDMTVHLGKLCASVLFPGQGPCVLEWDGIGWNTLASGKDVRAVASYAGDLYVAGNFTSIGGVSAAQIARWNGSSWSALGSGIPSYFVASLEPHDGSLFVGGLFLSAGGVAVEHAARWDGEWHATSASFVMPTMIAIQLHDGVLFGGGTGNSSLNLNFVRWTGSTWVAVSTPFAFFHSLATWGEFLCADGVLPGSLPIQRTIGRWDGQTWTPVITGADAPDSDIVALESFQSDLYLGGKFTRVGGVGASYVARIACVPATCKADCDGSGTLGVADFGCFQSRFLAGVTLADCNQDFRLTVADFGCFQTWFVQGCP